MLIIIGTAGSREKNIVSGITPAVNNNPTTTNTTFSARSRRMVPPLSCFTRDVRFDKPRTCFGNRFLRNGFLGTRQYGATTQAADRNREPDKSRIRLGLLDEVRVRCIEPVRNL